MEIHANENAHPLALSFSDLSVWCYACEAYIDNQVKSVSVLIDNQEYVDI